MELGGLSVCLCFRLLRLQYNRELALFLWLPVIGCTTLLFEGRLGSRSVYAMSPSALRYFWLPAVQLPLGYWLSSS